LEGLKDRENVDPQVDGIEAFRAATSQLQIETSVNPVALETVHSFSIEGRESSIPARFYAPFAKDEMTALPILLFIHGGAWVIGDLDSYDSLCRYIAAKAEVICISVDYRLAPEHPFPAALNDCMDALHWIARNAVDIGGSPDKICVAGDSAGGTLAAALCHIFSHDETVKIARQILMYPCLDPLDGVEYPSRKAFGGGGFFLEEAGLRFLCDLYIRDQKYHQDPRMWPGLSHDLRFQPNTLMILAELDLLRDEGLNYVSRLKAADVPVECIVYDGTIHGFICFAGVIDPGLLALGNIVDFMKKW